MALLVSGSFDTPFGTTVNNTYWRWVGMGIEVPALSAQVTLYGYVNVEAFNTGKANIGQKSYTLNGAEFGQLVLQTPTGATISDVISNAVYAYVVANDEFFSTATEV